MSESSVGVQVRILAAGICLIVLGCSQDESAGRQAIVDYAHREAEIADDAADELDQKGWMPATELKDEIKKASANARAEAFQGVNSNIDECIDDQGNVSADDVAPILRGVGGGYRSAVGGFFGVQFSSIAVVVLLLANMLTVVYFGGMSLWLAAHKQFDAFHWPDKLGPWLTQKVPQHPATAPATKSPETPGIAIHT